MNVNFSCGKLEESELTDEDCKVDLRLVYRIELKVRCVGWLWLHKIHGENLGGGTNWVGKSPAEHAIWNRSAETSARVCSGTFTIYCAVKQSINMMQLPDNQRLRP